MIRKIHFILLCVTLIALVGCTKSDKFNDRPEWVNRAVKDYNQGIDYDMSGQMRLAEMYYRRAYEAIKEKPSQHIELYGMAGFRYSFMLFIRGDKEGALTIASDVLAEAEKHDDFPATQMSELLYEIALCEKQLGQFEAAKKTYLKAYEARAKEVGGENQGNLNMVLMCDCLFDVYLSSRDFDGAGHWLRRSGEELAAWEQTDGAEAHLVREYWDIYALNHAHHETLVRALGTNRTYLGDALRECAGTTPTDFINRYRIRHAALLLSTSDDPVALVAEQCGITNRSTFARLFRDHYSMTPTEYRKAAR